MNPDKVLCPCYKVTKGDIVRAVEEGASSFKEVKEATRVSKACGKCKKKAKKFTKKILEKKRKEPAIAVKAEQDKLEQPES